MTTLTIDCDALMATVSYQFNTPARLIEALTHRSFVNEASLDHAAELVADNERLEYLGDAVVDLVVGAELMRALPQAREGQLSKLRAMIVSEASLADAARAIELGKYLRLGRGEEQTGGRGKSSILANALEAMFGATYLDGGYDAAAAVVKHVLGQRMEQAVSGGVDRDYKTRLQELAQAKQQMTPRYVLIAEHGPDHAKQFEVAVMLGDVEVGRAQGASKKEAEQRAAEEVLRVTFVED